MWLQIESRRRRCSASQIVRELLVEAMGGKGTRDPRYEATPEA